MLRECVGTSGRCERVVFQRFRAACHVLFYSLCDMSRVPRGAKRVLGGACVRQLLRTIGRSGLLAEAVDGLMHWSDVGWQR